MSNKTYNTISRLALSDESKDWLTAILDPYHDSAYDAVGLPDERTAPSVVQIHNQTLSLSAPTSAGNGNWDAAVSYTGFNTVISSVRTSGLVNMASTPFHTYDHTSLSTAAPFGALSAWAGASGSTRKWGAPLTVGDTYAALGSCNPGDRCRLVGVGFEIHNTTADVYKQGTLTVAQLADVATDNSNILYHDTAASTNIDDFFLQCDRSPIMAATVAPLLATPGSQVWPAEKGLYAIPRMVQVPRETAVISLNTSGRGPLVYSTDGTASSLEPYDIGGSGNYVYPRISNAQVSGFTPIEAWLTGLSPQTTLTITFRTVVEYFPALTSSLLPMAEPSPRFDPQALALYSEVIRGAPYAVPVGQNPGGEYFKKIMAYVSEALGLLSPMSGPFAPVATVAAPILKKWANTPERPRPEARIKRSGVVSGGRVVS